MSEDLPEGRERAYQSFDAFFPHYLREHAKSLTRAWHYVGTTLVLVCLAVGVLTLNAWWLAVMPIAGYFFAWVSHAFVERNKPATFTYPLWSLMADFRMYFLALRGKLGPHLAAAGVV